MAMYGTCLLAKLNPLEHVISHELFSVSIMGKELAFTNHMLMVGVGSIVLMIALPLVIRKRQLVPNGFYNIIETICVFIREDVCRPFLKGHTDRYIGYLWSIFFFILTLNLLGMVPFNAAIGILIGEQNNLSGAATANLYVTGALASFAFLLFHAAGIYEKGFVKYFATLAPPVPWPMMPFMFFMELVSSFVRLFSLAIRLFANILAGHILLAVLLGFIILFKNFMVAFSSILATTLMSLLEIFVAFLQAYIFTFLTAIFIGFAINEEH
ncbi:MAG: ATP synthase F0 subunit A [Planctomycetota bacterium]|nr:MAG: ATP synthase F0 subunit A [Planctomycetota bacterium]